MVKVLPAVNYLLSDQNLRSSFMRSSTQDLDPSLYARCITKEVDVLELYVVQYSNKFQIRKHWLDLDL